MPWAILSRFSYTWKLNNAALTPVPGHCAPSGLLPSGAWRSALASARSSTVRSRICQPAARSVSTVDTVAKLPAVQRWTGNYCLEFAQLFVPPRSRCECSSSGSTAQLAQGLRPPRWHQWLCHGFGTPPVLCGACCPVTRSIIFSQSASASKPCNIPSLGAISDRPEASSDGRETDRPVTSAFVHE